MKFNEDLLVCPECAAAVPRSRTEIHSEWHDGHAQSSETTVIDDAWPATESEPDPR